MSNPIRFVGTQIGWAFVAPWLGLNILMTILVSVEPYAPRDAFDAAGQNFDTFPVNWATSLEPATNDIPWEPFVDPLPIFEWDGIESLSNYLATVHYYSYQWSTDCVEWVEGAKLWSDDAQVPVVLRGLLRDAIPEGYRTNLPPMLLWRAKLIETEVNPVELEARL